MSEFSLTLLLRKEDKQNSNSHHLGQGLGGQAGDGVGLVNGGGNPPLRGGLHHREGGIAAGAHHQVRLKAVQDGVGLLPGLVHVQQGSDVVADGGRREGPPEVGDGHRLNGVPLLGHQPGLHAAVGTHEQHLTAGVAGLEHLGQGHGGIDMARRSPAGKEDSHSFFLLLVM